jgi:hypothetical protein
MVDKFGDAQPLKEGSSVCRYCYCEVKQWVGLTDEDMKDTRTHNFNFIDGARWAEAKLKDKNCG